MDRRTFLQATGNRTKTAQAICHRCPSEQVCLMYGMSLELPGLRFGVFGGQSPVQRDAIGLPQEIAHALYLDERQLLWETVHSSDILSELRSLTS